MPVPAEREVESPVLITLEDCSDTEPMAQLGAYRPHKNSNPYAPGRTRAYAALIQEAEALEGRVNRAREQFAVEFGEETPQELPCASILRTMSMEATRFREMAELVDGGDGDYRPS